EKVRHAVTKLSDLHFVANKSAAGRVEKMGEHTARIHVTGCPSIDLAAWVAANDQNPELQSSLQFHARRGVGEELDPTEDYIVCMQHPVTYEWTDAATQVMETLIAVNESDMPC